MPLACEGGRFALPFVGTDSPHFVILAILMGKIDGQNGAVFGAVPGVSLRPCLAACLQHVETLKFWSGFPYPFRWRSFVADRALVCACIWRARSSFRGY